MDRTVSKDDTPAARPRSLSDLRSFLHGYQIRVRMLEYTARAQIMIKGLDRGEFSPAMRRTAQELAEMDPALAWLPTWKPRISVALAKGNGT